tara:strand:+ start:1708 stop:1833 length:126 start_codon:yes stop_codon:yes gene_type:complete
METLLIGLLVGAIFYFIVISKNGWIVFALLCLAGVLAGILG